MNQSSTEQFGRKAAKAIWRKSSYSDHNGDCVELAEWDGMVALRDSKCRRGPVVSVGRRTMTAFVSALAAGQVAARRH